MKRLLPQLDRLRATTCSSRARRQGSTQGAAGFTLSEVLIALGILAVGITSVASLFPPAILLQKETVRDILSQQNIRSSEALFRAKALDATALFRFTDNFPIATNDRAAPDDIDAGNTMGAVIARGFPGTITSTQERWVVAEPEFDLFAVAEIDEYLPPVDSTATAIVTPPTVPGPGQGLANYIFPDMRASTTYGTTGLQGDTDKTSYARHQSMLGSWGEIDRSYPSYIAKPDERELYIVPLIRRGIAASEFSSDWQVFSLILERYAEDIDAFDGIANPYPNTYPGLGSLGTEEANAIVCANPFDAAGYFPKVFRIPAVDDSLIEGNTTNPENLEENEILLLVPNSVNLPETDDPTNSDLTLLLQPGDMMLGDDGRIYRVVGYPDASNLSLLKVTQETRQDTSDFFSDRSLRSVWIGLRPSTDARNPLRDVRVLSAGIARAEQ